MKWTFGVDAKVASFNDHSAGVERSGNFSLISLGIDYLINPRLLFGVMAQFDHTNAQSDDLNSLITGNGWLLGIYVSSEPFKGLFF
jgi:hypothetical protein